MHRICVTCNVRRLSTPLKAFRATVGAVSCNYLFCKLLHLPRPSKSLKIRSVQKEGGYHGPGSLLAWVEVLQDWARQSPWAEAVVSPLTCSAVRAKRGARGRPGQNDP